MDWTYLALFHVLVLLKCIQAQTCPGTSAATGCYVVGETKKNWKGAQSQCQTIANSMGRPGFGYLASITDDTQYTFIKSTVNDLIKQQTSFPAVDNLRSMWIGGYEESVAGGNSPVPNWKWVDDTLEPLNYQGCFKHDPADFSYSKQFPTKLSAEICIAHCYSLQYSIAVTRNGDTCGCGNSYKGNGGTKDDCTSTCKGGFLSCGGPNSNQIYIINGTFSEWNYNQPNNFDNYQSCGHVERQHAQSNIFVMGDKFCRESHAYICSVPMSKCDNREAFCYKADNKCFYYDIYQKKNWFKSREDCRKRGGDLAITDSRKIMDDMSSTLVNILRYKDPVWIGLIGQKWMWDDKKEFIFNDFSGSHPIKDSYNCLRMVSNQQGGYSWEDFDCSSLLSYLCFIDTVTPLPTTTTTTPKPTTTTVKTTTKATATKKGTSLPTTVSSTQGSKSTSKTKASVTNSPNGNAGGSATSGSGGTGSKDLTTLPPTSGNTTDPDAGKSTAGGTTSSNTFYIIIGVIGGILVIAIIAGLVCYKVKKGQSEFPNSHVHPDTEVHIARPPDSDRTGYYNRRAIDEASTVTTSNIKTTMDPLPDLTRDNSARVHESRFRLDPIDQSVKEEKKKKKKKKDKNENKDGEGNDTERRRKKKKSKRSSMDYDVSYENDANTVVDMSAADYNY